MRLVMPSQPRLILILVLVCASAAAGWGAEPEDDVGDDGTTGEVEVADADWSQPVPGWKPVAPGEHPRLFFRRDDIAALRQRAATPVGQELVARLRALLGGGDAMPTVYSNATQAYATDSNREEVRRASGPYTISHAAGFGFLFQLTGERRYADLARQCVEKAWAGQRDRDDRYAWVAPGGFLRAGPTLGWYAVAYDLCYDGWEPSFRELVAKRIMEYDGSPVAMPGQATPKAELFPLKTMATKGRYGPWSNHHGAVVGGATLALLAVRGDPGIDTAACEQWLAAAQGQVRRCFTAGFGDAGMYAEGPGPSHMMANTALIPALQALRIAAGRELCHRPEVWWVTMRWPFELITVADAPFYPIRAFPGTNSYGTEYFLGAERGGGLSHGGWFSQGFAAIPPEMRPALLWAYQRQVAASTGDAKDALGYPHRAMLALINWPLDIQPENPATILPRIRFDRRHGYVCFRNRWQDADDILVSAWLRTGPRGFIGRKASPGASRDHLEVVAWGLGERIRLGGLSGGTPVLIERGNDGSGTFGNGEAAFTVDFSKRAGVDALIVTSWKLRGGKRETWPIGGEKVLATSFRKGPGFSVVTFSADGVHPQPRVDGDRIVVGGAVVRLQDGMPVVEAHEGSPAGRGAQTIAGASLIEQGPAVPEDQVRMPSATPLLHLTFDEDTLATAGGASALKDIAGAPRAVFAAGSPVFEKGRIGGALRCDGETRLEVAAGPDFHRGDLPLSTAVWLKLSDAAEETIILERDWYRNLPKAEAAAQRERGLTGLPQGLFQFAIWKGTDVTFETGANHSSQSSNAWGRMARPAIGRWVHLAAVYEPEPGRVTYYIDGRRISSGRIAGRIAPTDAPLHIAARGGKASDRHGLNGVLDDLRLYAAALTPGEIYALYRLGTASGGPLPAAPAQGTE